MPTKTSIKNLKNDFVGIIGKNKKKLLKKLILKNKSEKTIIKQNRNNKIQKITEKTF